MLGHCVCVGSFAILIKFLKSVGVLKYVSPVFVFLEIVKKKKKPTSFGTWIKNIQGLDMPQNRKSVLAVVSRRQMTLLIVIFPL